MRHRQWRRGRARPGRRRRRRLGPGRRRRRHRLHDHEHAGDRQARGLQELDPNTDPGRFNLQIEQGTTGSTPRPMRRRRQHRREDGQHRPHDVGETAGTVPVTSLADYQKSIKCIDTANGDEVVLDQAADDADASVQVDAGDDIVCTITNTRETGKLEVFKKLDPNTDPGALQPPHQAGRDGDRPRGQCRRRRLHRREDGQHRPHDVGETGGTVPVTSLADYQKSIKCIDTANGDEVVLDQAADDAGRARSRSTPATTSSARSRTRGRARRSSIRRPTG